MYMYRRNEKCNKIWDIYTKCKYSDDKQNNTCYIILLKYLKM